MIVPKRSITLSINLTPEQIGFLAYIFPNEDPEIALIKFLDRARNRAIRRAEQQVRVLYPDEEIEEGQEAMLEQPISQIGDVVENPVGKLQELCQRQQISLPRYEFEVIQNGFRCTLQAMGLQGVGEGTSKKEAKMRAAEGLLEVIKR